MVKELLQNKKEQHNLAVQLKLCLVIKQLQEENTYLKQIIQELEFELQEKRENVDAKKLTLVL